MERFEERQYLYFFISKASKLSTCGGAAGGGGCGEVRGAGQVLEAAARGGRYSLYLL